VRISSPYEQEASFQLLVYLINKAGYKFSKDQLHRPDDSMPNGILKSSFSLSLFF
jgi:hypothetical protein